MGKSYQIKSVCSLSHNVDGCNFLFSYLVIWLMNILAQIKMFILIYQFRKNEFTVAHMQYSLPSSAGFS